MGWVLGTRRRNVDVNVAQATHNWEGTQGPGVSQKETYPVRTSTLLGTASEKKGEGTYPKREFSISEPRT